LKQKKAGLPVKGKPAVYFKKYNMASPQQRKVLPHQSHIDLNVVIFNNLFGAKKNKIY
jgi:hypothetical protein